MVKHNTYKKARKASWLLLLCVFTLNVFFIPVLQATNLSAPLSAILIKKLKPLNRKNGAGFSQIKADTHKTNISDNDQLAEDIEDEDLQEINSLQHFPVAFLNTIYTGVFNKINYNNNTLVIPFINNSIYLKFSVLRV